MGIFEYENKLPLININADESKEIFTPGDELDVLVAMNPAGLKVHLNDLKENGILIINTDNFQHQYVSREAIVVSVPKSIKTDIKVGDEIIVSFPNMGHWLARLQLFFKGRMPITSNLPYRWHNTPNIHLCTINDFLDFCEKNNYEITEKYIADNKQKISFLTKLMPNLFGEIATFRIK